VSLVPKCSLVRPLVQNGIVVTPVKVRNVPITSSSLTQGTITRTRPVHEIVLAVAPEEVGLLAEAMDLKYEITCVTRSGRPAASVPLSPRPHSSAGGWQALAALAKAVLGGGPVAASAPGRADTAGPAKSETPAKDRLAMGDTPGLDPMSRIRFMEVMIGPQRQFVVFARPGSSPVVTSQDAGPAKADSAVVPAGAVDESEQ
jgi:hypothetical protein